MERDDAIELVAKLVDLFPNTNDVQGREWVEIFIPYPVPTVSAAIQAYYRTAHRGFLDGLMAVLKTQHELDRNGRDSAQSRVARAREDAARHNARLIADRQAVDEHWREIDQGLGSLGADELARQRDLWLASLPKASREFFTKLASRKPNNQAERAMLYDFIFNASPA